MIAAALFVCAAIGIHDADGPILCATGEKIRLHGVAARELDGSCRPTQPCPVGDPIRARAMVARAIGAKIDTARSDYEHLWFVRRVTLSCQPVGTSYRRIVADCATSRGADVSCLAIEIGAAVRWARYDPDGRLVRCRRP